MAFAFLADVWHCLMFHLFFWLFFQELPPQEAGIACRRFQFQGQWSTNVAHSTPWNAGNCWWLPSSACWLPSAPDTKTLDEKAAKFSMCWESQLTEWSTGLTPPEDLDYCKSMTWSTLEEMRCLNKSGVLANRFWANHAIESTLLHKAQLPNSFCQWTEHPVPHAHVYKTKETSTVPSLALRRITITHSLARVLHYIWPRVSHSSALSLQRKKAILQGPLIL